jgi:hypothetical protein
MPILLDIIPDPANATYPIEVEVDGFLYTITGFHYDPVAADIILITSCGPFFARFPRKSVKLVKAQAPEKDLGGYHKTMYLRRRENLRQQLSVF